LLSRVMKTDTCWLWQGTVNGQGYGAIGWNGKQYGVHRVAFMLWCGPIPVGLELWCGPIPVGLEVDHLCGVRNCVRPDHLEAVTHKINNARSQSLTAKHAAKTHCIHGHPLTPENVWLEGVKRRCLVCKRRRQAEWKVRRRTA